MRVVEVVEATSKGMNKVDSDLSYRDLDAVGGSKVKKAIRIGLKTGTKKNRLSQHLRQTEEILTSKVRRAMKRSKRISRMGRRWQLQVQKTTKRVWTTVQESPSQFHHLRYL